MKISVIIHPDERHGYWAEVPAVPGCVSQGETIEEVTEHIREALSGMLVIDHKDAVINPDDRILEIDV